MRRRCPLPGMAMALLLPASLAHAQGRPPDQVALTRSLAAFTAQVPRWTPSIEDEARAQKADYHEIVAERARALCALMPELDVHGWRGLVSIVKLSLLRPTFYVSLRFTATAEVTTWGQLVSLADFPAASTLHEGALVAFDGRFVRSRHDCLQEQSSSDLESLRTPAFSFRFTRLEPVAPAPTASIDLARLDQIAFVAEIGWLCDYRFGFPRELKAALDAAIKPLPAADQALASKTWDDAYRRAETLYYAAKPPDAAACAAATPEAVAQVEDVVFGKGSVLHE